MAIHVSYEEPEKKKTIFDKAEYFVFNNIEYIVAGLIGVSFIAGISVGSKSTINDCGRALDTMNSIGFIRYFDKDGKEIFGEEAIARAEEIVKNVRPR